MREMGGMGEMMGQSKIPGKFLLYGMQKCDAMRYNRAIRIDVGDATNMYVRWVIRRHKNASVADTTFHDAYLVESYRNKAGKPRQRTICYLGNIRQIGDEFPCIERELFLLRAERILAGIAEMRQEDRDETMELLRQKVQPLTSEEVLAAFIENLRWYRNWWAQNEGGPSEEDLLRMVRDTRGQPGPL